MTHACSVKSFLDNFLVGCTPFLSSHTCVLKQALVSVLPLLTPQITSPKIMTMFGNS